VPFGGLKLEPEALYMQLGELIAAMPDPLDAHSSDVQRWLGRAVALLESASDLADTIEFKIQVGYLGSSTQHFSAIRNIQLILHRALARAELASPAHRHGSFVPAGEAFSAMAAIGKVVRSAAADCLIVDPYMDETALTDFAVLVAAGVRIRLLADASAHKASLPPAVSRWRTQYSTARPLDARLAAAGSLHDRLVILDDREVWVLTQSLNKFAARAPASIVRADVEVAAMKVSAYRALWAAATPI
jgi:hypothetical protein